MRNATMLPLVVGVVLLGGCALPSGGGNSVTSQPVQRIALLSPGMSKQDAMQILGAPARTEFSGTTEAWHYCRTGTSVDEFAVVLFSDGKVTGARNYNVTLADTGGATGDCSKFVRSVLR